MNMKQTKSSMLLVALLCTTASWAQTNVSTDQELRSAIANNANIKLTADIDLSNSTLEIPSNQTVTIDLGGFTLNRGLKAREWNTGGTVITVRSNATLNLSNGTLKGGWGGNGGGLVIEGGTANLKDVTITGNVADDRGGGISNYGTLIMTGGAITDNTSHDKTPHRGGGGLFNEEGAKATLTGVTISGNKTTEFPGGGICNHGGGTLTLDGCTITGNTAGSQGGGIWQEGTLNIQGANNITGNTNSTNLADNLYLPSGKLLTVSGALTGSNISISMEASTGTFTSGYSTYNSGVEPATIFSTELPEVMKVTLDGNEAQLTNALPEGSVYYIERSWDENSKKVIANTVILNEVEYTLLTARDYDDDLTLSGGTYVVKTTGSDKVYVDGFVKINGDTKLILCDGATMKVEKTIRVAPGRNFSVYGQIKDSGLLQNDADLSFGENYYCGIGTYDGKGSTYSFHGSRA
jgi:hypothetical protein